MLIEPWHTHMTNITERVMPAMRALPAMYSRFSSASSACRHRPGLLTCVLKAFTHKHGTCCQRMPKQVRGMRYCAGSQVADFMPHCTFRAARIQSCCKHCFDRTFEAWLMLSRGQRSLQCTVETRLPRHSCMSKQPAIRIQQRGSQAARLAHGHVCSYEFTSPGRA